LKAAKGEKEKKESRKVAKVVGTRERPRKRVGF